MSASSSARTMRMNGEGKHMTGQRYVSAWENGLRHLGGHWVKDGPWGERRTKDDSLDSLMQMDHVIRVDSEGLVHNNASGVFAPEITINVADDGMSVLKEHEEKFVRDMARLGWSVESGWSGQNSGRYNGPIMHDSEFIGGSLAEHILTTPGYWVACVATTLDPEDDEGWVLLHQEAKSA